MILPQYFVGSENEHGDNMDLFVTAKSPVEALDLWRTHFANWDINEKDIRVWLVPPTGTVPTAHEWIEPVLAFTS